MNRSGQNFIIDALMFVLMAGLAGIGLLVEYVLVPGREVPAKYGFNADVYLFGLERDQWADIHLWMAYALLGLMALHIWLHWRQVCAMYRNLVKSSALRRALTAAFIALNLALCLFFLVFEPELREFARGVGRGRLAEGSPAAAPSQAGEAIPARPENIREPGAAELPPADIGKNRPEDVPADNPRHRETGGAVAQIAGMAVDRPAIVRGMYTLGEVAASGDVPVSHIKASLGLPESVSANDKLGRLRRVHGFTMSDVERIIREYGSRE